MNQHLPNADGRLERPANHQLARNNSRPVPIGPDEDFDYALVHDNRAHFFKMGWSLNYLVLAERGNLDRSKARLLEGPALVRYLARTGKERPHFPDDSIYNPNTGYFDPPPVAPQQPLPSVTQPSSFWGALRAFLGIGKDS